MNKVKTGRETSVLVIDDEESVRLSVTRMLSKLGFATDSAAEGYEGLQKLLKNDYALVIVDLNMRRMDGIAFIQEARKIWPWLAIIILTGYNNTKERKQAAKLGVTTILNKPCKQEALKSAIETELARETSDENPAGVPTGFIKSQLNILRQISESALNAENVLEALTALGAGLGRLMPCSSVSLLYACDDPPLLVIDAMAPLSENMIDAVRKTILNSYEAVSGRRLDKTEMDVRIINKRGKPSDKGKPESIVAIPVIIQEHVSAMFALASAVPNAFTKEDVSFLYHAANHLSMVMLALSHMRQLATHDALTGLYNHAHLEKQLALRWAEAEKHDSDISLAIMDVDYFKNVNDIYGHLTGDQVLKELAELVKTSAGTDTITARYGGDEFVIVLPGKNLNQAENTARALAEQVANHVFSRNKHNIKITVSTGIADRSVSGTDDSVELLSKADQTLYEAKRSGRNKVCAYSASNTLKQMNIQAASPQPGSVSRTDQQRPTANILLAEDDPDVRAVLHSYIPDYHHIHDATTFQETFTSVKNHNFDIILLDIHFPDGNGLDILPLLAETENPPVVIVITGDNSAKHSIKSLKHGVYDFITKPFKREDITATVEKAAEIRRRNLEEKDYHRYLEELVREKSVSLTKALEDVQNSYETSMEILASLIDAREHNTGKHSVRVRELAVILGKALKLPQADIDLLAKASLLHDIGKIAIPDSILLKKGMLTPEETAIMQTHPQIGLEMLRANPYLRDAAEIIYSHHEKYNGTGYPRGLKGEEICLGARIFAIIDAYDAMRANRIYSPSMPADMAAAEIKRCSGSHFDPRIVDVFCQCLPEIELAWRHFWNK